MHGPIQRFSIDRCDEMSRKGQAFVVGISAPTGGGKTTLVNSLSNRLGNANVLSFDEYDDAGTIDHPASFRSWLRDGADYDAWKATRLAEDLEHLKSGSPIVHPIEQRCVNPKSYIIFDAPLGRAHRATGRHIDCMVYLDTPLDVAMARRILRDFYGSARGLSDQHSVELRSDLEGYLTFARFAYLELDKQVKPTSDVVLDGLLSPDELTDRLVDIVLNKAEGGS